MTPTVQQEVEELQAGGPQEQEFEGESRDPVPVSPGVRKRDVTGIRSRRSGSPEGRRRGVAVGTDIGLVNLFNVQSCGVSRRQDVLISSC